jgi:hypothetical protein
MSSIFGSVLFSQTAPLAGGGAPPPTTYDQDFSLLSDGLPAGWTDVDAAGYSVTSGLFGVTPTAVDNKFATYAPLGTVLIARVTVQFSYDADSSLNCAFYQDASNFALTGMFGNNVFAGANTGGGGFTDVGSLANNVIPGVNVNDPVQLALDLDRANLTLGAKFWRVGDPEPGSYVVSGALPAGWSTITPLSGVRTFVTGTGPALATRIIIVKTS